MKRLLFLLFLSLHLVSANAKSYITTQDINVREGAGTNYAILGVLKNGTNIEISEVTGTWGKINYKNRQGYVTTNFLSDGVDNSQVSIEGKNKNLSTIVIILGLVIFLFIFRKSSVVRYFAPVMTNLLSSSSNNRTNSNSDFRNDNGIQKNKPIYWYVCRHCDKTIKQSMIPNSNGCPTNYRSHSWGRLAECGDINYSCRHCSKSVMANSLPNTNGCSSSYKIHSWIKL